jgi:hypothetical protein
MIVTSSAYFTPAFNTAIFDGAIRIYFAQHQEPVALSLYFRLREILGERRPKSSQNVFIMIYPASELYSQFFLQGVRTDGRGSVESRDGFSISSMGEHMIIGVSGGALGANTDRMLTEIALVIKSSMHSVV